MSDISKIAIIALAAVAIAVGLLLLPKPPGQAAPAPPSQDSAVNTSFERGGEGYLPGWSAEPTGGGWTRVFGAARSGYCSMRLAQAGGQAQCRLVSDSLPAQQGDWVTFHAWVRVVGEAKGQPQFFIEANIGGQWQAVEPKLASPMLRMYYPNEWVWAPRGVSVFAPSGTNAVRVVVAASPESDVEWYVDDFDCRVVSFAAYAEEHRQRERLEDIAFTAVDTQAQGYLGCYGSDNATPIIDALAREGRLYRKATTACPWTKPSFGSMFTSRYPSEHGAELLNSPLDGQWQTLAEALRARGYFTAGFARTPYDGFLGPAMGFDQGFDVYFYHKQEDRVFEAMTRFLETNIENIANMKGGGLFLFWHFYEPHSSYRNHDGIENHGLAGQGPFTGDLIKATVLSGDSTKANEKDIEYIRACYASENRLVDERLGTLLDIMRKAGLYEKLNIVYCADHGESFGEKEGIWDHGHPYITCTQIPFILRLPGRLTPGEVDEETLVSNLDIMPTLLALTGMPAPQGAVGRDLLAPSSGHTAEYGISEDRQNHSIAIRDGRYKLILNDASVWDSPDDWASAHWVIYDDDSPTRYELYDLAEDPLELNNLYAESSEVFIRLKAALDEHCQRTGIASAKHDPKQDQGSALPEELRENLEATGYLDSDTGPSRGPSDSEETNPHAP